MKPVICEKRKQCATIQHVPGRCTIAFEFLTHTISICRIIIVVDAFKHAKNMLSKIENYEWIEWQIMHLITYRHRAEQINHWEDHTRSQVNAGSVRHLSRWYVEKKEGWYHGTLALRIHVERNEHDKQAIRRHSVGGTFRFGEVFVTHFPHPMIVSARLDILLLIIESTPWS